METNALTKRRFPRPSLWAVAMTMVLGGCSLAPTYRLPATPVTASYKGGNSGLWQPARPGDALPRSGWWTVYKSTQLDQLEHSLDADNPTLAAALARYSGAQAYVGELRSGLFPHLELDANPSRQRQSDNRPLRGAGQPDDYDANTIGLGASYEVDLWGRVRNEVAAGRAQAQAASADLASAKLSLEAQLADMYIRVRGDDVQARILDDSIHAYTQALQLTRDRFDGGIASQLDVSRASAQLSDARAQTTELMAQRALAEHAIARLIGQSASSFSLASDTHPLDVPAIPLGVPSTLLQRRPDIAAAERLTFAANANVGVARAAFFPSLNLSAGYGWQNTGGGGLLSVANTIWAIGPLAALTLFDGGLRHAREREAKANFDITAANYRATVLGAFQQVEDNLTLLDQLGRESQEEDATASSARDAQDIATNRYREGTVNYLEVVTAQNVTLQAQRASERVRTRRLQASVDLIRALGGGWEADELAAETPPAKAVAARSP